MVPRGNVAAHQAQPLGNGVEHVLALYGRVFCHAAGAFLIAAQAGAATPEHARVEHGRGVQRVRASDVAAAGVRVAAGAVVAAGVHERGGRTGGFGLHVGTAAGRQVSVIRGHSVQQPVGGGQRRPKRRSGASIHPNETIATDERRPPCSRSQIHHQAPLTLMDEVTNAAVNAAECGVMNCRRFPLSGRTGTNDHVNRCAIHLANNADNWSAARKP